MFLELHGELAGSHRLELLHYWKILAKEGYNAGITYQHMIEQATRDKDCSQTSDDVSKDIFNLHNEQKESFIVRVGRIRLLWGK